MRDKRLKTKDEREQGEGEKKEEERRKSKRERGEGEERKMKRKSKERLEEEEVVRSRIRHNDRREVHTNPNQSSNRHSPHYTLSLHVPPTSDGTLPGLCSSVRNIPGIAQAGPGIFLLPVCLFVLANSGGDLADVVTVTEAGGDKVVGVRDLIAAHGNESVRMRPCRGHTKTTYPFSFQAFPYSAALLNDRKPKSSSDLSLRALRSGWRDPLEFQENGISTQVLAIREL